MIASKMIEEKEITSGTVEISQRHSALVAGFGLLIMFVAAMFANFFVIEGLVVPGDAAATANNIMANEPLFRLGIASFVIILFCDVLVAWGLYVFLKPVNESLSLLAAWLRLVYTAIFGITLLNLFNALQLLSDASYLTVFEPKQLYAQMMVYLNAFSDGWLIGLLFFGFHLFVLGYLVLKSGFVPRILGILLIVASFGYLVDSFAQFLLPNYSDFENIFLLLVALPAIVGELGLSLWLLFKGGKERQPQ